MMPGTISIFDLFSTFPRDFRLALLVDVSQVTKKDISFVETIGMNRGVMVRIYYEKEQALQWLEKG